MILSELVLYWTGSVPFPPVASRVFPLNWNVPMNESDYSQPTQQIQIISAPIRMC